MNGKMGFPNPAAGSPVQAPIVYVKDSPTWEYKRLTRNLAKEQAPTEDEMNALGRDGWDLAGILTDPPFAFFYLKRLKK